MREGKVSEIRRYDDTSSGVRPYLDGTYMEYQDYVDIMADQARIIAAIQKENEELRAALDKAIDRLDHGCPPIADSKCTRIPNNCEGCWKEFLLKGGGD